MDRLNGRRGGQPSLQNRAEEYSQPGGNHVNQEDRFTEAGARSSGWPGEEGLRCEARDSGLSRRLRDLHEQVDLVLPEMTARIAALEHLLLEKQLCTRKDLIDARQFVRMQEA